MAFGDAYTTTGRSKLTDAEAREHQDTLLAKRVTEIPSDNQLRCDYDTRDDGQPVYLGTGAKGLPSSTTGWLVQKFTYNSSGYVTLRQSAIGIWDSRASLSYT